jgi:hypothetical protein
MSSHEGPTPSPAERFGMFVADAARKAGYDIDSQRGGGRVALARDTGMSASSVGRMLAGQTLPTPRYFEPLAAAVRVPLRTLLIESGVVSEDAITAAATAVSSTGPLTAEQAASRLGITIPANVQLFVAMVENMQRQESGPKGKPDEGVA